MELLCPLKVRLDNIHCNVSIAVQTLYFVPALFWVFAFLVSSVRYYYYTEYLRLFLVMVVVLVCCCVGDDVGDVCITTHLNNIIMLPLGKGGIVLDRSEGKK